VRKTHIGSAGVSLATRTDPINIYVSWSPSSFLHPFYTLPCNFEPHPPRTYHQVSQGMLPD